MRYTLKTSHLLITATANCNGDLNTAIMPVRPIWPANC